jgi:ABC-type transporter Mla subunit MlaD
MAAKVTLSIKRAVSIPQTATAVLTKPQAVGNPYVAIEVTEMTGPMVPQDGTGTLKAIAGETSLIPQQVLNDVTSVSKELQGVAHDIHVLLAYTSPEDLAKANPNDPNRPRENASTVIIRLNRTVESLQKLLTDPDLQGNVRTAIQNIADASSKLKTTLDKINLAVTDANGTLNSIGAAATQASSTLVTTQTEIARLSQKLAETLTQLQKTVRDISAGQGTTGRLIQDPRLYDSLLDLSTSLKGTVERLNFLIDKWKDEGVNLKLK